MGPADGGRHGKGDSGVSIENQRTTGAVNWEAYSHDELYQMLWQDADVADVSTVATEWAQHRAALDTHAEVLREQRAALLDELARPRGGGGGGAARHAGRQGGEDQRTGSRGSAGRAGGRRRSRDGPGDDAATTRRTSAARITRRSSADRAPEVPAFSARAELRRDCLVRTRGHVPPSGYGPGHRVRRGRQRRVQLLLRRRRDGPAEGPGRARDADLRVQPDGQRPDDRRGPRRDPACGVDGPHRRNTVSTRSARAAERAVECRGRVSSALPRSRAIRAAGVDPVVGRPGPPPGPGPRVGALARAVRRAGRCRPGRSPPSRPRHARPRTAG